MAVTLADPASPGAGGTQDRAVQPKIGIGGAGFVIRADFTA